MSWNRPSEGKREEGRGKRSQGNARLKGLVAGAIVVVGAGLAAWWLWPVGERAGETPPPRKEGLIREVAPVGKARRLEAPKVPEPEDRTSMPTRVGQFRNGYRMLADGTLHKVGPIVVTCRVARVSLAERTFEHSSDVDIADLLLTEPGDEFVGESEDYYDNFEKRFRKALETKIEIAPDDSDEVRELKTAVIEARAELKAHLDAGEDLTKLMRESREQLRELGLYRAELDAQVSAILKEKKDLSPGDMKDLVNAANEMLKERGAKPLQVSEAYLHHLVRKNARERTDTEEKSK